MESSQELRRYYFLLLRWWWLIALCTLLGAGAAFAVSFYTTPVYSASATMLVNQAPTGTSSDYQALVTTERLATTYSQMMSGRPVMETVIAALGLPDWPDGLAKTIQVSPVRDTNLIRLSVERTDPYQAARIANAIADAFSLQIETLQEDRYADSLERVQTQMLELAALIEANQAKSDALEAEGGAGDREALTHLESILASDRSTYAILLQNYEQMRVTAAQSANNVVLFEPAQISTDPVRPRTMQNTMLAAVVGAMLAVGTVFLIEYLDDTIKTPDDVQRALGLSTLGAIGLVSKEEEWVVVDHPRAPVAEAYRALRTNIRFSSVDKPLRTLVVTSAGATEGKSVTVANLAAAMAQSGLQVIAVDADLRRPRLHKIFGLRSAHGLTEAVLRGGLDGGLQAVRRVETLRALPTGSLPPNPAEVLGSQRMGDLLETLAGQSDIVLIDSPPVLLVTDAVVLAQKADGVLLVLNAGQTRREAAARAVESLHRVGANVIGVVLNAVPAGRGGYYYYYYQDYYDSATGKPQRPQPPRNGRKKRRSERRRPAGILAAMPGLLKRK